LNDMCGVVQRMGKRKGLIRFPQNVFEWSKAFGDDLGYEATRLPRPVESPPGSPEKIAAIIERLGRGQALWIGGDAGDAQYAYERVDYRVVGDERFGAVVGKDPEGRRHRYCVWIHLGGHGEKLHYITAAAGYRDSFGESETTDRELSAIRKHAESRGASFVAVGSLFSARVLAESEVKRLSYPVTGVGMLWLRWMTRYCDKSIACWGDTKIMDRAVDVLWMLSRTSIGRHVYVIGLTPAGFPSPILQAEGCGEIERYEYRDIIADREREEGSDDDDDEA